MGQSPTLAGRKRRWGRIGGELFRAPLREPVIVVRSCTHHHTPAEQRHDAHGQHERADPKARQSHLPPYDEIRLAPDPPFQSPPAPTLQKNLFRNKDRTQARPHPDEIDLCLAESFARGRVPHDMSTGRLTLRRRVSKIKTRDLPAAKPPGGHRPDDGRGARARPQPRQALAGSAPLSKSLDRTGIIQKGSSHARP